MVEDKNGEKSIKTGQKLGKLRKKWREIDKNGQKKDEKSSKNPGETLFFS